MEDQRQRGRMWGIKEGFIKKKNTILWQAELENKNLCIFCQRSPGKPLHHWLCTEMTTYLLQFKTTGERQHCKPLTFCKNCKRERADLSSFGYYTVLVTNRWTKRKGETHQSVRQRQGHLLLSFSFPSLYLTSALVYCPANLPTGHPVGRGRVH